MGIIFIYMFLIMEIQLIKILRKILMLMPVTIAMFIMLSISTIMIITAANASNDKNVSFYDKDKDNE